jgi:hypothetical protein
MQPVVLLVSCRGLRRATARWCDACGQTTTEWLMIAGLLTAVGIFLQALMSSTLWKYSHQLIYGIRTIAP